MMVHKKRSGAPEPLGKKLTKQGFKMATGPIEFFKQVRSEAKKVTWPTRQETTVSTIAVFVMVFIASLFLFFADQVMAFVVRGIMSIGL